MRLLSKLLNNFQHILILNLVRLSNPSLTMSSCAEVFFSGSTHNWRISWPSMMAKEVTELRIPVLSLLQKNVTMRNIELSLANWKWYWHVDYHGIGQLIAILRQYNSMLTRAEHDVITFHPPCIVLVWFFTHRSIYIDRPCGY